MLWFRGFECLFTLLLAISGLREPLDAADWDIEYGEMIHGFAMQLRYIGDAPLHMVYRFANTDSSDHGCNMMFFNELHEIRYTPPRRAPQDPLIESINATNMTEALKTALAISPDKQACWFPCRDSRPELPLRPIYNSAAPGVTSTIYLPLDETKLRGFFYINCAPDQDLVFSKAGYWIGPSDSHEYQVIMQLFDNQQPMRSICYCRSHDSVVHDPLASGIRKGKGKGKYPKDWRIDYKQFKTKCVRTPKAEPSQKRLRVETTSTQDSGIRAARITLSEISSGLTRETSAFDGLPFHVFDNLESDKRYQACVELSDPKDGHLELSVRFIPGHM